MLTQKRYRIELLYTHKSGDFSTVSGMGIPGLSPQTSSLMHNVQNSNDIIHVNKSKCFTPVTETRTRGSHGFKYFIAHTSDDIFKYSYFPRTMKEWNSLPSDIVSAKSLDIFKSM